MIYLIHFSVLNKIVINIQWCFNYLLIFLFLIVKHKIRIFAIFKIRCFEFDIIKSSNLFRLGQWQKYSLKNFLRNSV